MDIIGDRIKERREALRMSQAELASQARVAQRQISRYERHEATPVSDAFYRIARALGVTTDYLFGAVDDPQGRADLEAIPPDLALVIRAAKTGDLIPLLRWIQIVREREEREQKGHSED
jgi:transcriptional regulator with XRE-family HTH domain